MLAPSAYLASAAGSASISQAILPTTVDPFLPTIQTRALVEWKKFVGQSVEPPTGLLASKQRAWDTLVIKGSFSALLQQQVANPRDQTCLQACRQKEIWCLAHRPTNQ